jgi:hypothetical protein
VSATVRTGAVKKWGFTVWDGITTAAAAWRSDAKLQIAGSLQVLEPPADGGSGVRAK